MLLSLGLQSEPDNAVNVFGIVEQAAVVLEIIVIQIFHPATRKVIHDHYLMTVMEQALDEMAADKARTTRDQSWLGTSHDIHQSSGPIPLSSPAPSPSSRLLIGSKGAPGEGPRAERLLAPNPECAWPW